MSREAKAGLDVLLTPESAVALVDHQSYQFVDLLSHEPAMTVNSAIAFARVAELFDASRTVLQSEANSDMNRTHRRACSAHACREPCSFDDSSGLS
ncbi:hypothetical protein HTV45_03745 [Streptomyces sp. CHD11]|uniref:hypothetical protein n=1 Tax=Streptomyces sp. CHD11 TaxID=2741325 RepID=UPI001BFCB204|nr:hypothetical protein [Streptomyces sp. CHD11]MBT3150022.1 hypothetical protein [Streptomyces sp. CHD11]